MADQRGAFPELAIPQWLWMLTAAAVVLAAIGLVLGFSRAPLDTWLWLIVTFVIASGIANGMLAWAAAFRVAQARWTPAVARIGQSAIASVPVLVVLLAIVLIGAPSYQPWAAKPIPEKQAWLNIPFLVTRDALALGIFWLLSLIMVRWSLAADAKALRGEEIPDREHRRLNAVAAGVVVMYALTSSIVAIDLVMALSPGWVSTMFPVYYFCTNFYIGLGAIVLLGTALRRALGVEQYLKPQQFQDMGNLMLAFALFNMGLFFAQYLTIWYENISYESAFLLVRYVYGPWPWLAWPAFAVAYGLPFIVLQSRSIKQHARLLSAVAAVAIPAFVVERYVLVVPSLKPGSALLYLPPVLVLVAVVALSILSALLFLRAYSPVSHADEALRRHAREDAVVR